jgi:hypothetical protein
MPEGAISSVFVFFISLDPRLHFNQLWVTIKKRSKRRTCEPNRLEAPMNRDLLITYLVNFAYTMLKALIYAVGCFLAWRAFDLMDKIDIRQEITERKNLGWAIMIAAIFIGLAYVVGQI